MSFYSWISHNMSSLYFLRIYFRNILEGEAVSTNYLAAYVVNCSTNSKPNNMKEGL